MRNLVVGASVCQCDQGSSTNLLVAATLPTVVIEGQVIATVSDILFSGPFGSCDITHRGCSFSPSGSWSTVVGTVLLGGQPPLVKGALLPCSVGGVVEVLAVAQGSVELGLTTPACGVEKHGDDADKRKQLLVGLALGIPIWVLKDAGEGEAQQLATEFINKHYPNGDSWVRNAARHGVWMGVLSAKYGTNWARAIGEIHERYSPGSETDHWIDRYNNKVARRLSPLVRKDLPYDMTYIVSAAMKRRLFITDPEDKRVPAGLRCVKKR